MRFPSIPRALLHVDGVVLTRPSPSVDAEGNDVAGMITVASVTRGFYALPSAHDQAEAGQRAALIDAVLAFPPGTDVRSGDRVVVRGSTFEVLTTEDARNRIRAHIQKITTP